MPPEEQRRVDIHLDKLLAERGLTVTRSPFVVHGTRVGKVVSFEGDPGRRALLQIAGRGIEDAARRGWSREVERHTATAHRIAHVIDELQHPLTTFNVNHNF